MGGQGPPLKAVSWRERGPYRAVRLRSPQVNLSQIHHYDSQEHKLDLPEAVLTSEFNFKCIVLFLTFRLESRCHDGA